MINVCKSYMRMCCNVHGINQWETQFDRPIDWSIKLEKDMHRIMDAKRRLFAIRTLHNDVSQYECNDKFDVTDKIVRLRE